MSEYKEVKKRGGTVPAVKYPEQHQKLIEMGFDAAKVFEALSTTNGNLEGATAILLGEPNDVATSRSGAAAPKPVVAPMKTVGKPVSTPKPAPPKQDIREVHNKFMAMYKIVKCKEKNNHDKRNCVYWHSRGDRRRNPFEIPYTCLECPNSSDTVVCPEGDNCMKAHNMLERMFHPELFKISMCQRGPTLDKCDRGPLCAFAHSEEDHRIPESQRLAKIAAAAAAAVPPPAPVPTAAAAATPAQDPMHSKAMPLDSKHLDDLQDKLLTLIKSQGSEGIISSELPKRYADAHHERLDMTDESGERFRIKDLLLQHPCIQVQMHKGVQPKYVWVEPPGYKPPASGLAVTTAASVAPVSAAAAPLTAAAPLSYASRASSGMSYSNVAASSKAAAEPAAPVAISTPAAAAPAAAVLPPVPGTPPKSNNATTVSPVVQVSVPVVDSMRVRRRPQEGEAPAAAPAAPVVETAAAAPSGGRRRGPDVSSAAAENGAASESFSLASLGLADHSRSSAEVEALEGQLLNMKQQYDLLLTTSSAQFLQLKQERASDLALFKHNIGQIEGTLLEIQRQELMFLNTIPHHETINKSSRARDELTKFVSILKGQLSNKLDLLEGHSKSGGSGGSNSNSNGLNSFLSSSSAVKEEERFRSDVLMCSLPGCKLEGSFICSACGKAQYCGADHQREHWAQHINECSL